MNLKEKLKVLDANTEKVTTKSRESWTTNAKLAPVLSAHAEVLNAQAQVVMAAALVEVASELGNVAAALERMER